MRVSLDDGAPVELGAVLAKAGEGTVYELVGQPESVAKVFHPDLKNFAAKVDKVRAMVDSSPRGAIQADGFVVLTWPQQLVYCDGAPAGYLMSRIDTATAVEIHAVSNPSARANPLPSAPQWMRNVMWDHLVHIGANLCLAVDTVHHVDAVIGDFQERNILVSDTTRVTLVDCDSMQFTDSAGHQFLCSVGRPEFTAPELAGADLRSHAREKPSDLFALAIHLHQLLMAGNHPFLRGEWSGGGDQPDALILAKSGYWAGGWQSPLRTHPLAPPISFLPRDIQQLFHHAFSTGAHDPAARPTALQWRAALRRIRTVTCPAGSHQIPTECHSCPWCTITAERTRRKQRAAAGASAKPHAAEQTSHSAVPSRPTTGAGSGRRRMLIGGSVAVLTAAAAVIAGVLWDRGSSPAVRGASAEPSTTASSGPLHYAVTSTIPVGAKPYGVGIDPATHSVFVTNSGSDSVSVLDGVSHVVTGSVQVGQNPTGVGIDTGARSVFITNGGGNTVTVLDASTNTVISTARAGELPFGVAIDPGSHTAFVTNFPGRSGSVSVLDGPNHAVSTTVPVGQHPTGVALDPGTHTVLVTNLGDGTVSVIDSTTRAVTATVPGGQKPYAVVIDPSSHAGYVADFGGNAVLVLDPTSNAVTATISVGQQPDAVAIDTAAHTLLVANRQDNTVTSIDMASNAVTGTVAVGRTPFAVDVDPTSHTAYVANQADNTVSVLSGQA